MTARIKSSILWKKLSMSQKLVLFATIFLFFFSACFVFWKNQTALDPNLGKSWWIAAFSDVETTDSLSFFIENHTPAPEFQYRITVDDTLIHEEHILIPPGESMTLASPTTVTADQKNLITIFHDAETRTLYR